MKCKSLAIMSVLRKPRPTPTLVKRLNQSNVIDNDFLLNIKNNGKHFDFNYELNNLEEVLKKEKEVGIMVKFRKGAEGMDLHLFPNKEAMRKWRGADSEQDAEGEYREWSVPLEVIEDLWAAASGEE